MTDFKEYRMLLQLVNQEKEQPYEQMLGIHNSEELDIFQSQSLQMEDYQKV
ncbi:hypothetical protein H6769_00455 [Candidatus Peribacteria bacterium]|nr:hypothetical protein [Candidatus Peribacteria bacterium]